jgi:hypothetical protein
VNLFQAAFLGAIEGLTEFLPVSSTGHLILAAHAMGLVGGEMDAFEIVIQAGALLAVLWLYRDRVASLFTGLAEPNSKGRALLLKLIVAFLPAAALGFLTHKWIKAHLFGPRPVAIALIAGGLLILFVARWMRARGGYALSVPAALLSYKTPNMKLSIADDRDAYVVCRDQPTLLTALANVPAYGDGMKIAPRAKLDDGQLDICCIDQISRTKLLRLFPTVYFGKHLGIPEVHYFHAKRLKLESDRPLDVYADGEYVCQTPIEVGVARATLRVITP